MNTYILLDESSTVLNIVEMPPEPVDESTIELIKNQGNGASFLRLSNSDDSVASVETIFPVNSPLIGALWDGTGFLAQSPSPEFMLDHTGYNWIPMPPDINNPGYFEWDSEHSSWIKL